MFNFGNFLTKNAITFDQKEIERKKLYLVGMKFRCASNAAIKNVKIARKKINFFSKIFSTKSPFFKKIQIFRKYKVYFQILEVLPVILTTSTASLGELACVRFALTTYRLYAGSLLHTIVMIIHYYSCDKLTIQY